MGNEGFTGPSALLYHIHPPTTVLSVRRLAGAAWEADPDRTLRHRHFRTAAHQPRAAARHWTAPRCSSTATSRCCLPGPPSDTHFYRNAQADEVVYVSQGSGVLETQFGDLPYREGDYS